MIARDGSNDVQGDFIASLADDFDDVLVRRPLGVEVADANNQIAFLHPRQL